MPHHLPFSNPLAHEYHPGLKKLTVRGMSRFPAEILNFADDIEILDMSFGELSVLPDDFGRLHRLKVIFLSYNPFTEVPPVLADCPALVMIGMKSCKIKHFAEYAHPAGLQAITLTDNQLTKLPHSLGTLHGLRKLMVAGNRLRDLPRGLLNCGNLQNIRVPANEFATPPNWLFQLPQLAWYSEAGNPFCSHIQEPDIASIPWEDITVGDKIGESAKSAVYKGRRKSTGHEYAVKIYGSQITTDGYPADEIRANVAAGNHPHIVGVHGRITGMPGHKMGLLMDLVPAHFKSLGHPPDLHTLTRDTFPAGQTFSLSFITTVARDIRSALQHLHSRGVMHGDIYAHNILADDSGRALLCDFGAASLYTSAKERIQERADVRGYGYLLDDLLLRCEPQITTAQRADYDTLDKLRAACLNQSSIQRPLFADISL